MSTKKNGGGDEIKVEPQELADIPAEALIDAWARKGGIELATQKVAVLRDLIGEKIAAVRAAAETAKAELAANSAAMEKHFAALGFPGGPPVDEAEVSEARKRGVRHVPPIPPTDDGELRKMLVARVLVAHRDAPNAGGPTTRGLARWCGAPGKRIDTVLAEANEVRNGTDGRWVKA